MTKDEKKDETYYVGFPDAVILRKEVLETARAVVKTLQMHARIKELQDEKLKLRTDLAHLVHQLKDELHKLEAHLPARDLNAVPPPVKAVVPRKVVDHRLDKIESALSEIEQRMRSL